MNTFKIVYTTDQWAAVEKTLEHLHPEQRALEAARVRLERAMGDYATEIFCGRERAEHEKTVERDWKRIAKLSHQVDRLLRVRATEAVRDAPPMPPPPDGGPPLSMSECYPLNRYPEILKQLMMLRAIAHGKLA